MNDNPNNIFDNSGFDQYDAPPPFPQNNEYCNSYVPYPDADSTVNRTPIPRPAPSDKHNAFRDEPSATAEVIRKKHFLFGGARPQAGEPTYIYESRMRYEHGLLRTENKNGLRASVSKLSLLLLLYIVMYQVITNTVPLIAEGFGLVNYDDDVQYTLFIFLLYILVYPVTFSLIIYLGNLKETHRIRTFFRKPKCSPFFVLKWFVIVTSCTYIVNLVFNIITTALNYDTGIPSEPFTSPLDAITNLVVICIFAPILEEILFRGVMLSHHMKYGAWHACIVTSICFALFHTNLSQLFYTFIGGLFMSMVVLKTGSLIPSIIIHASFNFISYLSQLSITLIDNYPEMLNGIDELPKGSDAALIFYAATNLIPWILLIAGIIMLIVELTSNRASLRMPKGDSGLTAREKAHTCLSSLAVWSTLIVALISIIITEILIHFES